MNDIILLFEVDTESRITSTLVLSQEI